MPRNNPRLEIVNFETYKALQNRFKKKITEENKKRKEVLDSSRNMDEIFRHLQVMYVQFGEDLFKITDLDCKKFLEK
jgi:hypothetical protein